jgi:hypothetical protein
MHAPFGVEQPLAFRYDLWRCGLGIAERRFECLGLLQFLRSDSRFSRMPMRHARGEADPDEKN